MHAQWQRPFVTDIRLSDFPIRGDTLVSKSQLIMTPTTYLIVTVLLLVFVLYQFYPWFKLRAIRGKPAPPLGDIPGLAEDHPQRLLLYFTSPSCGMCRNTTPIIEELAATRNDVVHIDVTEQGKLAARFRVMGTPSFVVVNDGLVEQVKLGVLSRAGILALLEPA